MKKPAILLTYLFILFGIFLAGCSNCDDGDTDESSTQMHDKVADSTFVK